MLERYTPILRIVCLVLAALVCAQLVRIATRKNPLDGLTLSATAFAAPPAAPKAESKPTNAPPRDASRKKQLDLPPEAQARVDRITQSEILGAIVRPLPMALLGIAGHDVFLRAPNGQTGLVREGEEFGGVKLLRVGTNRVLVEHENQQKELTLFSGFGSESLMPKEDKGPQ